MQIALPSLGWRLLDLHVASQRELAATVELQSVRFHAEHADTEVRHATNDSGTLLQLVAMDSAFLESLRSAAKAHKVKLQSVHPFPIGVFGYLTNQELESGRICLVCPHGDQTLLTVVHGGQRETALFIPASLFSDAACSQSNPECWQPVLRAIRRLSLGIAGRIDSLIAIVPDSSLAPIVCEQLAGIGNELGITPECRSPAMIGWQGPVSSEFLPAIAMTAAHFTSQLDFSRRQNMNRTMPYRVTIPIVLLVCLVLAVATFSAMRARQRQKLRDSLEDAIADLDSQLEAGEAVRDADRFLRSEWQTPPWLPALTEIAKAAPAANIDLRRVTVETSPAGERRVQLHGHTESVHVVLNWNQALLDRREDYDVVPHAIESNPEDSELPKRFAIELVIPPTPIQPE